MNKHSQSFLYSPLLGAILSSIVFLAYSLINTMHEFNISVILESIITVFPFILIVFSILSYVLTLPVIFLLEKIQRRFLFSEGFLWFLAFLIGIILGASVALINYHAEHKIVKAFLIAILISFSLMFNASLFSVINEKIRN